MKDCDIDAKAIAAINEADKVNLIHALREFVTLELWKLSEDELRSYLRQGIEEGKWGSVNVIWGLDR